MIWDIRDEEVELRVDKSGEYGTLLFKNMGGDVFAVCLGAHNYNVWCGMTDDCKDDDVERVSSAYWGGDKESVRWDNRDWCSMQLPGGNIPSLAIKRGQRDKKRIFSRIIRCRKLLAG